jgi:hypothetical protein
VHSSRSFGTPRRSLPLVLIRPILTNDIVQRMRRRGDPRTSLVNFVS